MDDNIGNYTTILDIFDSALEYIGNRKCFQPGKVIRDNDATATGKLRAQAMQAEAHAQMPLQATQNKTRDCMVPLIDQWEFVKWRW